MVTLPYSPLSLLGNSFASSKVNPNPFVVLQYVGDSDISPSIDQWYDNSIEPVVVDTNTDLFNIFLAKESVKESFLVYIILLLSTGWVLLHPLLLLTH